MPMSVQIEFCDSSVCLTVSAAIYHTACADLADVQNIMDKVCCHGKTIYTSRIAMALQWDICCSTDQLTRTPNTPLCSKECSNLFMLFLWVLVAHYAARQQGSEVLLDDKSSMLSHGISRTMTTQEQPALLIMQQPCQLLQGKLHRANVTHFLVYAT